jgi:hypothetical protein
MMATDEPQSRIQLAHGLLNLAESLRQVSQLADHYAGVLMHNHIDPALQSLQPMANMHPPHLMPPPPPPPFVEEEPINGRKRKISAPEGEEGKRKRKLKDPNAPKRPPSSYILFQNEVRQEIKRMYPELSNSELLAHISKMWAEMSEDSKAPYNALCATAKEAYTRDKAKWDALSPEQKALNDASGQSKSRKPRPPKANTSLPPDHVSEVDPASDDSDIAGLAEDGGLSDEDEPVQKSNSKKPMSFDAQHKGKKHRQ